MRVVIAGEFEHSVRKRLPQDEAASFVADRGLGVVGGKMIERDGRFEIVLNARFLRGDTSEALQVVRALIAHEFGHVAIWQRDGQALFVYERLNEIPDSFAATRLGLAAKVLEEARVERWLYRANLRSLERQEAGITGSLQSARQSFVALTTNTNLDVQRLMFGVIGAFRDLITFVAYLASEDLESPFSARAPAFRTYEWANFVGPFYNDYKELLAAAPPADTATSLAMLDGYAIALAPLLDRWFSALGYRIDDDEFGMSYFDIGGFAHDDADRYFAVSE